MHRSADVEVGDLGGAAPGIVAVLRALRPSDGSILPAADSGRLQAADSLLGAGPVAWVVEAAHDARSLGLPSTAAPGPSSARFHESLLLDVVVLLAGGGGAVEEPVGLHELARDVERGGGADLVAHLRGVQRFWTGLLLDHAVARSAAPPVLREITVVVGARFDGLVDEAVTVRGAGRPAGSGPRAERRRRLVESLVAGAPLDPAVLEAELDVDVGRPHVALVLTHRTGQPVRDPEPTPASAAEAAAALDVAAGSVGRALGGSVVLQHATADGALWVWLAGARAAARSVPADLDAAVAGVAVGVGGRRTGSAGLRRSHLEARDAHRFATGPRGPVVRYEDVAFAALLGRDRERARWFVTAQLGPLAGDDETSAELRRTLCAYYSSGMRLATTAMSLDLHRNTLVNRLRRIEKILGREVADRVAETHSALLMIDGAGSSGIGSPTDPG